jgi:hypothetical protein
MNLDPILKKAAEVTEHLDIAEGGAHERNWASVRIELDHLDVAFEELRERYRAASGVERPLIAQLVRPLRARYDRVSTQVPPLTIVSEGAAEPDPEEEIEPQA